MRNTVFRADAQAGPGVAAGNGNYVASMKDVGSLERCPVVDMTASTKALVEQYGPAASKSALYVGTDDTHLRPLGATLFAQLAVQELIAKGILASHVSAAGDLVVSPASLDFKTVYSSVAKDLPISVTGLSLSPDAGNVTVTAPPGFLVSATATGPFASILQLPYAAGKLAPAAVYVRFQPTVAQAYAGDLVVAPPTGSTKMVALAGTGAEVPVGGTETTVVYALTADATCAATGLATCSIEALAGLEAKSYSAPNATSTTWTPSQPASTITQRLQVVGGSWPADTGPVAARYAEFAVAPAAGKTWTIDSISLWAGAAGGSKMAYRIEYSKQADFSASILLLESLANGKDAMALQSVTEPLTVSSGETLRVRVYPWNTAAATGKYRCLQSLTFHGTAQ